MGEETLVNQVVRRVKIMADNTNGDNISGSAISKYLPLMLAVAAAIAGYTKLQASVENLNVNVNKQEQRMEKLDDKIQKYVERCEQHYRTLANNGVNK